MFALQLIRVIWTRWLLPPRLWSTRTCEGSQSHLRLAMDS